MTDDERLAMLEELAALKGEPSRLEKIGTAIKEGAINVGKSLGAGFGKAAAMYPLAMSKAPGVLGLGFNALGAGRLAKETGEFYDQLGKESKLPEWAKPAVEGAAGAFAMPSKVVFNNPLTAMASNAAGNTSADLTQRFTKDMGETPSTLLAALAGIIGGGGTAFALGPKQNVAKADLRDALQGANFGEAKANADLMLSQNSPTGTLAEAFPPNSQVMALARKARGAETGGLNPLVAKTQGRADELTQLGNSIPEAMGGRRIESGEVAQTAANAANERLGQFKAAQIEDYGNLIKQAKPVLPQEVVEFRKFMLEQARNATLKAEREAYITIANSVKGTKGVLTNPRELVDAVKLAKEQAIGKNEGTASIALKKVYEKPYQDFVDFLKDRVPEFKKAEEIYPQAGAFIDAKKAGPLGQVAGANFDPEKVVPVSRLGVFESQDNPDTLKRLLSDVQAGDPNNPTLLSDIAKAIVQRKVRSGPADSASKLAAAEGSNAAKMFDELLTQTGTNNPQVQAKLKLARLLQDFQGPAGISTGIPDMRPGQALLRPFRTVDMMLTGQFEKGVQREIAQLLADPKNLAKLQEIAMFDPAVRQALVGQMAIMPGLTQAVQQESR